MDWWQKLKRNPLARFGAVILGLFYLVAIAAEFVAPYDPYATQVDGALLPPTAIHWRSPDGQLSRPFVYPTTQGPVSLETGERDLNVDTRQPSPIQLFVQGSNYSLFRLILPLPPNLQAESSVQEIVLFQGFQANLHLFGTADGAYLNLLGTDEQARDQFSRLVYVSRISLSIGLVGIAIAFPLGMLVGGIAGYFGGIIDAIVMFLIEVIMTIPSMYLLIALAAVFVKLDLNLSSSQRFLLIVIITSFISWTGLARVIRGQVLSIKQRAFVQASRAMGGGHLYTIIRHILPQTATYVIISSTLAVPSFIVAEAVLSLIGLGIQQPDPSWGNMLSLATNASVLVLQPWLVWSPAALIVMTVLSFNLLGDGLRDALDPRNLET
ncbi:MAG: ABC transporter permease [Leptolyngbyaceae bacterium]|nr:ABC transporter permease [Leptolyngbyaceae bacterium]